MDKQVSRIKNVRIKSILKPVFFLLLFVGCSSVKPYEGNIIEFSYQYGSFFGGYYDYHLVLDGDALHVTAQGMNGVELNIDKNIDASLLEELSFIINTNNLERWDGFSKDDPHVLDGYSFNMLVKYDDGRTLEASGYEKYPENYDKVHEEIVELLSGIE